MGIKSINFADIEGGFENVPEGLYDVEVTRVELRESKSSENPYFNWYLKVLDEEYEGKTLFMMTSLSPKALFRLKDVFEALDVLEDDMELEWDDDVEITPAAGPLLLHPDVIGAHARARVKNEVYEGKEQNRVDELLPPEASTGSRKKAAPKASTKGGTRRRALR